jgi:putative Mg2+ transporter-C (MgtC) family protein
VSGELTAADIGLRLLLAFAAGGVIGFERSSRHQVAGMRTHILIALGAALLMLLSIWLPRHFGSGEGDPGRIAAQVVSGIGFLGAGAMIRLGNNIRGLTTAASLWLIAAVGLALGAGMYAAAAVTEVLSLFTLVFMDHFEKRFFPTERNKVLVLNYGTGDPDTADALAVLGSFHVRIQSMDVEQIIGKGKKRIKGSRLRLFAAIPDTADISALARALEALENVTGMEMEEKF